MLTIICSKLWNISILTFSHRNASSDSDSNEESDKQEEESKVEEVPSELKAPVEESAAQIKQREMIERQKKAQQDAFEAHKLKVEAEDVKKAEEMIANSAAKIDFAALENEDVGDIDDIWLI